MRLIDADAFDKCLADGQAQCNRKSDNFRYSVLGMVRGNLAKFPTAYGWISVKDRLPEPFSIVLCFMAWGGYDVKQFEQNHFFNQGSYKRLEDGVVTHWMPLPEPPKEEHNDNDH